MYCRYHNSIILQYGPGVVYVDPGAREFRGYPVDPAVTAWHSAPFLEDLYQEEMAPHGDLFAGAQMWWQEPPGTVNDGLKFVRALVPKFDETHTGLYTYWQFGGTNADFGFSGHKGLPFKDGPRGVAWSSPYVTGAVDSTGGFAFVEAGGPLRYMKPDGEITTVAGWRVQPGKDPVWHLKPLNAIRQNMELRGVWLNGQYAVPEDRGFHGPFDVTIDSRNENVWYVAGFHDNTIWKVVVDRTTYLGTVSVLAGDLNHQSGYVDGSGSTARFNGPMSLTFDPISSSIYVADQNNDAIRKIDPDTGAVTTVAGSPGMGARLAARGLPLWDGTEYTEGCYGDPAPMQCYDVRANRTVANIEVSAPQAAAGVRPDIYVPMTIRVDSKGNIILLESGFATIRRINPVTGETKLLEGAIEDRFARGGQIGWMWLDVDRWGNSGPKDGIYWSMSTTGGAVSGEDTYDRHINELFAWLPPEGGLSKWVTGPDWDPNPDGWGPRNHTDIPHYPWNVTIDPRGAVYLSGIGEHGITRLRRRKPTDPIPTDWPQYYSGKVLWSSGDPAGGHSFALKFGWGGHNYLGFTDAWSAVGKTDQELISMFEIPAALLSSPSNRSAILNFIRLNSGFASGGGGQAPAPPRNVRVVP
jgi:DNA-binding beta-propeller fold protein YncE